MITVRHSTFETNSSSTHSFTVSNDSYEIKPIIIPSWDSEFGWSFECWRSTEEKLAYICRCLLGYKYHYLNLNDEEDRTYLDKEDERINQNIITLLQPLKDRLNKFGVSFTIPTITELDRGYVDHSDWYESDILEIIEADDGLLNFLFNENCYITGGNDNC